MKYTFRGIEMENESAEKIVAFGTVIGVAIIIGLAVFDCIFAWKFFVNGLLQGQLIDDCIKDGLLVKDGCFFWAKNYAKFALVSYVTRVIVRTLQSKKK